MRAPSRISSPARRSGDEDRLGDHHLADVVQLGSDTDSIDRRRRAAQRSGGPLREVGNIVDMVRELGVAHGER